MINPNDVYSYWESIPIISGSSGSTPTTEIGLITAEYEVREYNDIRNLSAERSYIVTCKQRINVWNSAGLDTLTEKNLAKYENYPIMLVTSMEIAAAPAGAIYTLLEYTPKTVNTAVNTSTANSTSSGSANTTTSETTSGQSMTSTNTFEVNGSVGLMGDVPTASRGGSFSHSRAKETYSSAMNGSSSTNNAEHNASSSNSMSIKNWGSYASVPVQSAPSWVWAQEYPWDVTQFHNIVEGADQSSNVVTLPNFVQGLLVDQTSGYVFPPSQLSLFGVNFLATAKWQVVVPQTYSGAMETLTITHNITCTVASHEVNAVKDADGNITSYSATATLDTLTKFTSTPNGSMDLVKIALDPIGGSGNGNGAVVGFVLAQFIQLPPVASDSFRIKSGANNVLVTGNGFTAPASNDDPMTADLANGTATFQVYFKIIDKTENFTLYIKHWISQTGSPCCMAVTINGLSTLYRYVETPENGGGSNNVTTIVLRDQDFSSADFYDYLILGMNEIIVTVSATDVPGAQVVPGIYSIRALAIG